MSAIWHDHGLPSFMGGAPQFSFFDVAQVVEPVEIAMPSYAEARARMQAWERRMGAVYLQHNAKMALDAWQRHRPWWLV